jgi:cell division protease FtsH
VCRLLCVAGNGEIAAVPARVACIVLARYDWIFLMEPDMRQEQPPENTPPRPPEQRQQPPPLPPVRGIAAWVTILGMMLLLGFLWVKRQESVQQTISYRPQFVALVESNRVEKCEIIRDVSGLTYVQGQTKPEDMGSGKMDKAGRFRVYIDSVDTKLMAELRGLLDERSIPYSFPPQNPIVWQILSSILPIVLIFGVLYFLFMRQMRSAGHGALSFGKSRAKLLNRDKNKITFEHVGGIDEAKDEVQEIIDFLKDPLKFQKLGGRIPKGVMLMGPPGTGKTLLAKAIAGEANVPFFSISGSDFVEMFVGVGASRVRDMFEQGKKHAPCIIFIDEIDAVGRSRFTGIGGGHDEREQTLNALLVQMDGFETQEGVIILAATNRPDVLDPALLRPGRFDRQVVIDLPMIDGRQAILEMHAKKITLAKGADLRRLARGTPGFSGADLENLLNEAALLAAREDKTAVEMNDLEEARDKVRWGRERRSRGLDEKEKRITAYHEAGHALVMQMVEESEPLHKITIIPRGVAYLGATMQLPEKDTHMEGKVKLRGILTGYMGGRVAEELVFGDITSGAASDLKEATRIARLMICTWGMSEKLGPQTFGAHQELMFLGREVSRSQDYSEQTAQRIDSEVSGLLTSSYKHAREILRTHHNLLKQIAELLLERETLDGRDVEEIVEHGRILSEDERDAVDREKEPSEERTESTPGVGADEDDLFSNAGSEEDAESGADGVSVSDAVSRSDAEPPGPEPEPGATPPEDAEPTP